MKRRSTISLPFFRLFLLFQLLLFSGTLVNSFNTWSTIFPSKHDSDDHLLLPDPTLSGYLPVNTDLGSEMFFVYYEAQEPKDLKSEPIVLWLQGGPGCSSLFGMLYINGPYFVNEDLTLRRNKDTWNRHYGMLFIDQPLGTGFSYTGEDTIPSAELKVASDLYKAIQNFYKAFPQFETRPLIITGESYAGKYVPSISHYILQVNATAYGYLDDLKHHRNVDPEEEPPVFIFAGAAIGNGFTDGETQIAVQAEVAWNMGLIDLPQRHHAEKLQAKIIEQLRNEKWHKARALSDELMKFIIDSSGSATLEDFRRNLAYDGHGRTDTFLNQEHVKKRIGARMDIEYLGCSPEVDQILGHDVMKSVKHLVVDLLRFYPILLYQGQFDAECGVASNDAWISTMSWPGHIGFNRAQRAYWKVNETIAGYWKRYANLVHAVIRNTGHMVPHDNPYIGRLMLEKWVDEEVLVPQAQRMPSELEQGWDVYFESLRTSSVPAMRSTTEF